MYLTDLKLTGGLALDRGPETFYRYSKRIACTGYGYPIYRRCRSRNGMSLPAGRGQLDAEARFHRSDARLWLLCAWL